MSEPNLSLIEELSGNDMEFRKKLIGIIKSELPAEIAVYRDCVMSDHVQAAAIVHKLKHKISILGMFDGYQVAEDYEEELKEGRWEGHEKFNELLEKMSQFVIEL
jgi:HPt (histidine-containing phosphotransfer) domain-containing protein